MKISSLSFSMVLAAILVLAQSPSSAYAYAQQRLVDDDTQQQLAETTPEDDEEEDAARSNGRYFLRKRSPPSRLIAPPTSMSGCAIPADATLMGGVTANVNAVPLVYGNHLWELRNGQSITFSCPSSLPFMKINGRPLLVTAAGAGEDNEQDSVLAPQQYTYVCQGKPNSRREIVLVDVECNGYKSGK